MAKDDAVFLEEEVGKKEEIKKKASPKKKAEVKMLIKQYFKKHRSDTHPYTRAYHEATFHGIIKSKEEWDSIMKDKL